MNVLLINAFQIVTVFTAIAVLYAAAIAVVFKNRSGILPYLALIFLPVIGPLGIILGNYTKKIK
ncbi:hypothetical protein [Chryseobacterium profundimaris]|uniref:Cardiolipin synthase N-terminal domain-containing protein n=1 Tax=Chryseobacterium profundimaris TaxID=1387275 RepID=A0ABY1NC18_9FLAO|nr:hypothetical protein [Chryseobacterium profundimaris]SMP06069.1 hypothetical protein SAMN06264346_101487 [Chryseobacterium profundimaris]